MLASAVGGWLGGYLADRIGRVKTLQLTILWFSVFSLLCAFVQNFDQLLIARALLGLGFGGEWAAGAVLMGESIRAQYRGRAVGSVQSGWAVGWGLAVLSQADPVFLAAAGTGMALDVRDRRAAGAAGVLSAALCRGAGDCRRDARQAECQRRAAGNSARFSPGPILKTTILASLAVTGCQGGYYAITFWVPRFLTTERKLSIVSSTGYLAALIIGSFVGYLVGAWLADKIGRRKLFLYFSLGAIAIIIALYPIAADQRSAVGAGLPARLFRLGVISRAIGAFLTELYPTRLRGSGQGFCYNFGRGIGALFPFLVGALSTRNLARQRHRGVRGAAYGLFFLAAFALPETRGRVLHADA